MDQGAPSPPRPWTFPGILFWAQFLWVFVWFRQTQQMPGWNTSPDGEENGRKRERGKKKHLKKGEVCEYDDFYDFSAPHTSFPTCLLSNRNLRELEEETTDLGWVGAAKPNNFLSVVWQTQALGSAEAPTTASHPMLLPLPPGPVSSTGLFPAKSDGSQWQNKKKIK